MGNFMNYYFGPLNTEYCLYFYFLSVLFFIIFVISVLFIILSVIRKPSVLTYKFTLNSVIILVYTLLPYFVNRLLYTMCINSTSSH